MNALRLSIPIVLLIASPAIAQPDAPAVPPSEAPATPPTEQGEAPPTAKHAANAQAGSDSPADAQSGGQPAVGEGGAPAQPSAAPIAADPAQLEKAKGHFKQGLAFAKSGDCSAATVEFQTAYEIIPRPNMLYNIAQCQERLFRYDLAVTYYERYLKEAPEDAPDRPAVKAALSTLGNLLGTLTVSANVPAEVWVDDHLAGNAPGDVLVPAGGHSLELRADGYIPKRTEVRVVGNTKDTVSLTLHKAQTTIEVTETTGVSPTLFWIGASATVIVGAVGGFFAIQATTRANEAEMIDRFHPDRGKSKSDVESSEFAADLSFAIAGALALGTTIVAFMTDWDGAGNATEAAKKEHAALRVIPVAGPDSLGLHVSGSL